MSQENVEVVRAAFAQYAQGDMSGLQTAFTDDFVLVTASEMPDGGTYRGEDAREWLTTYVESFDRFTMEASEIIDAGDQVVAAFVQRGCPRGSEIPVESSWWQVVTIRSAGVSRLELFSGRDQALEVAGLPE
jgi:ketosteroid isomerase-like protein